MTPTPPSPNLVAQRIRNRVIEYLELAASMQAQREYQRSAPSVCVPHEVINQWQDWVPQDPRTARPLAVYDQREVRALRQVQAAWEAAADALPEHPTLDDAQHLTQWAHLAVVAGEALAVFAVRGRLPEEA